MTATLRSSPAITAARFAVMLDFPVPPRKEWTEMMDATLLPFVAVGS